MKQKNKPMLKDVRWDFTRHLNRLPGSASEWTDFNVHDPGITTLEALCYAITDLSYRHSEINAPDVNKFVTMLKNAFKAGNVAKKDPRFRRFEHSLFGACRAVLEAEAKAAIDEMRAKSTCQDVETAEEDKLLQVLGYSPREQGIVKFLWDNRYKLAAMCHDFKIPHDCEVFCKDKMPTVSGSGS